MRPQRTGSAAPIERADEPPSADEVPTLDEPARRRLADLFHAHYDVVYRILRRFGLDTVRAEDGAQQVFVIAARRLDQIIEDRARAFLTGTAVNDARRVRRERALQAIGSEPPANDPAVDELVDHKQRRELLDRILGEMEDDLRAVLVLAEIEGLAKREIADALDIPEGTVASRLRRAKEDLHARLRRHQARVAQRSVEAAGGQDEHP